MTKDVAAAAEQRRGSPPLQLRGGEALHRLAYCTDVEVVLDIGSGAGDHARYLNTFGKRVVTNSLIPPADILGDYLSLDFDAPFDAIWACHVLEHQPNVGLFLSKCFNDLRDGGVLAITVPPPKHEIVGGHLTVWNGGLLFYNLIMAGFDCSNAAFSVYGYNMSALVRKVPADLPDNLEYDNGDIEKLARFFPLPVKHGFDGRLDPIRWEEWK